MEFRIKDLAVKIDYTFVFILCVAIVFGYDSVLRFVSYCVLHETGHLAALLIAGGKPGTLVFSALGIGLKYDSPLSKASEAFVIFSGPAVNLLLFFAAADEMNLFLALLNLIPVFPLDGGRLLKLLAPRAYVYVSFGILAIITVFAVYLLINHGIFTLLMICVYLFIFNMRSL